jgi:predicted component of type VI protein secretion system
MEHPLISSLEDFTPEQLLEKITELNRKLSIAYRMGNADLCNQIRMAIESHQAKYQEKIRRNPDNEFNSVIDIS